MPNPILKKKFCIFILSTNALHWQARWRQTTSTDKSQLCCRLGLAHVWFHLGQIPVLEHTKWTTANWKVKDFHVQRQPASLFLLNLNWLAAMPLYYITLALWLVFKKTNQNALFSKRLMLIWLNELSQLALTKKKEKWQARPTKPNRQPST